MAYTDEGYEDELIEWEREQDRLGLNYTGDARRCPRHPHVKTSSDDGMFDGLCGECEAAMDAAHDDEMAATACQGHPADHTSPMGETVYCDGSCRIAN